MRVEHTLFGTVTAKQMSDSIRYATDSLNTYGPRYKHWCVAWSGGKDSTALVTFVVWSIVTGRIMPPETLTILYADTRVELPPLWHAAKTIREELDEYGYRVEVVMADLANRFYPYMIGRGVPPPTNNFRWCTPRIKVTPMERKLEELFDKTGEKVLVLTGLRIGESAARDNRIVVACSKDGGECGQGWYQQSLPDHLCDKLAPLLEWRVCHVWEWLKHYAPLAEFGDFSTRLLADAYGGNEKDEEKARTGCIGCNLLEEDFALERILKIPNYAYQTPLRRLKQIYVELRKPHSRLRKTGLEPGGKNKQRLGPIIMEKRKWALNEIISIQEEVNTAAIVVNMPTIDIINAEEIAFIKKCWEENLWPDGWDGEEPTGDVLMDKVYRDGTIQPILRF